MRRLPRSSPIRALTLAAASPPVTSSAQPSTNLTVTGGFRSPPRSLEYLLTTTPLQVSGALQPITARPRRYFPQPEATRAGMEPFGGPQLPGIASKEIG